MENRSGHLWHLRLFGGPTLESSIGDGGGQSHFRSAKVAALLGYLALHHGKPCSREALIEALWPEELDFQALTNRFRVTLASLRRQLEPQGFPFGSVLDTSVAGCVILSKDTVWCDLTEFDKAYREQDFESASALLKGQLLPGIYEEWASSDQLRLELLSDELAPFRSKADHESDKVSADVVAERHRLPLFLSKFFAREPEMELLASLIHEHRLVTITGPGGVGKTRISVQVAQGSELRTVFVPLTDCSNREELCETIIRYLSISTQTFPDPCDQLIEVLQRIGPIRLLLDNAEHVPDEVADFAIRALDAVPELKIFVSSRQALEVMGEQIFRLNPLEFPPNEGPISVQMLDSSPATKLFLDRVRQSRPDFVPSDSKAECIVEICRRLEGLPLGIELAAAQITVHSVAGILEGLETSLIDLKSRRRSLSSRHRSLRAAIQSSLDGLDSESLKFLGKLSVFWGGWTVEHAEAVTGDELAIEKLEDLNSKSLVNTEVIDDKVRFSCLEVVRQLAQEMLTKEELDEGHRQHADYFLGLASNVDENDLRTLRALDNDSRNLNVAFQTSGTSNGQFWNANRGALTHAFIRGQFRSALKWIRDYGPQIDHCLSYQERCEWRRMALQVLPELGLYEEGNAMTELLRQDAVNNSDSVGLVFAEINQGLIFARLGDLSTATKMHRSAMTQARSLDNQMLLESALAHLSGSLHEVGRKEGIAENEKIQLLNEAEGLAVELTKIVSPQSRRHPLAHLLAGVAIFYLGRYEEAKGFFGLASTSASRHGVTTVTMYAAFFESEIARIQGQAEQADIKMNQFQLLRSQTGIVLGDGSWR